MDCPDLGGTVKEKSAAWREVADPKPPAQKQAPQISVIPDGTVEEKRGVFLQPGASGTNGSIPKPGSNVSHANQPAHSIVSQPNKSTEVSEAAAARSSPSNLVASESESEHVPPSNAPNTPKRHVGRQNLETPKARAEKFRKDLYKYLSATMGTAFYLGNRPNKNLQYSQWTMSQVQLGKFPGTMKSSNLPEFLLRPHLTREMKLPSSHSESLESLESLKSLEEAAEIFELACSEYDSARAAIFWKTPPSPPDPVKIHENKIKLLQKLWDIKRDGHDMVHPEKTYIRRTLGQGHGNREPSRDAKYRPDITQHTSLSCALYATAKTFKEIAGPLGGDAQVKEGVPKEGVPETAEVTKYASLLDANEKAIAKSDRAALCLTDLETACMAVLKRLEAINNLRVTLDQYEEKFREAVKVARKKLTKSAGKVKQ